MVTVGVNPVLVESQLVAGEIRCSCSAHLVRWGWARERRIHGLGRVRPRRGRCTGCGVTHVLVPVTLLSRRAYSAQIIVTALMLKARGWGHRRIGARLGVPAGTVRGWIRRMSTRVDQVRAVFTQIGARVWVDRPVAPEPGNQWQQLFGALTGATSALKARFAEESEIVTLTAAVVAVTTSAGRLLAPGWPDVTLAAGPTPLAPAARG